MNSALWRECTMTTKDLESLVSWLRCYPVAGRESERKRLQQICEKELTDCQLLQQENVTFGIEGTAEDKAELYWNYRKPPESEEGR